MHVFPPYVCLDPPGLNVDLNALKAPIVSAIVSPIVSVRSPRQFFFFFFFFSSSFPIFFVISVANKIK